MDKEEKGTVKETMDLYLAVAEMKRISGAGGTFSMRFRKWNRETLSGGESRYVAAARLRPKASDEKVSDASHKLFYTDTETGQARNCWQCLVTEFNGRKITIS